jgi:uncharacterized protein YuzE
VCCSACAPECQREFRTAKVTKYFQAIRSRPDRAVITDEWILRVIAAPEREHVQADGRVRRWGRIDEMDGGIFVLSCCQTVRPCTMRFSIEVMKVQYFAETDTLYIEFRERDIVESKDLDENTVLDLDADGNVCAITFEHASERTDVHHLTVEGIAA